VVSPFTRKKEILTFKHNLESQLGLIDVESLLFKLDDADTLVTVFSALLIESRLLFYSSNVEVLGKAVQASVGLLFPFIWQHIFIPVLPPSMLNYCCAPMPFVIGVLKTNMDEVNQLPMDDVVLVDLDDRKLFFSSSSSSSSSPSSSSCSLNLLPDSVSGKLVIVLKEYQSRVKKLRVRTINAKIKDGLSREKDIVLDSFVDFVCALLSFYKDHIDETTGLLNKESFIAAHTPEMQPFFQQFVMSQMFERFVEERTRRLSDSEVERRIGAYEASVRAGKPPKELNFFPAKKEK